MHTLLTSVAEPALSKDTPSLTDENGMYRKETLANGFTKHSRQCKSTFGRRDWSCHRCVELEVGAAPRDGWQHEYFARKLRQLQRRLF